MSMSRGRPEKSLPQKTADKAVELAESWLFSKVLDRIAWIIIAASAIYITYHILRAAWTFSQNFS